MKGNIIQNKKAKKALLRVVSVGIVFAMTINAFPFTDTSIIKDVFKPSLTVSAEDDTVFAHDENNNIEVDLSQLGAYSQRCVDSTYAAYHQHDNIIIKSTDGSSTRYLADDGFAGFGTASCPFAGTVSFAANTNITFNLNRPLFNYVYDTVTLNGGNPVAISRYYHSDVDDQTTPFIADAVICDANDEHPKATWKVNVVPDKSDSSYVALSSFGGLLGTMDDDAELSLEVTMDMDAAESAQDKRIDIKSKDAKNIGLICGTMGSRAVLNVTMSGDRSVKSVWTNGTGDAGGLIGQMGSSSTFVFTQTGRTTPFIESGAEIKTSNGDYAGGIVGENNGGIVTISMPAITVTENEGEENEKTVTGAAPYKVDQVIQANTGTGGLFGYYSPPAPEEPATEIEFHSGLYHIDDCKVNGTGSCGGLIGVMESDYNVTIDRGSDFADPGINSKHEIGNGTTVNYGGLIGKYSASSTSVALKVKDLKASVDKVAAIDIMYYGGAVGLTEAASYLCFDGYHLTGATNADQLTFGGLVAKGEYAFVDAKDVTIAVTEKFKGGGLVGDLGDGVLRMKGSINLEDAESDEPTKDDDTDEQYDVGQIVGHRDDALIFMESYTDTETNEDKPCTLTRSKNIPEVDDIGSWGEVLRFGGSTSNAVTTESLNNNAVLSVNESTHLITIGKPVTTITNEADFAKTALCFQLHTSDVAGTETEKANPFVSLESGSSYNYSTINASGVTIIISANPLNLAGTGLTGLTRDNDSDNAGSISAAKCVFNGKISGTGTVNLAIGDTSTGFNGNIYRHKYNGLVGVLNGGTIENITLGGTVNVKSKREYMYVGAGAARSTGTFTADNVTGTTVFTIGDDSVDKYNIYIGRLLGEASSTSGDIEVNGSSFTGNVTATCGNTNTHIGGVIGAINKPGAFTGEFTDVTTGGTLQNTTAKGSQRIGGLVADIVDASGDSVVRKITLLDVKADGLTVDGTISNKGSVGGMLGYAWKRTDVEIGDASTAGVTVGGTSQSTIKMTTGTSGNAGGLVYLATGYWNVRNLLITSIKVDTGACNSFGMIVNYGCDGANRLYMDLRENHIYTIGTTDFGSAAYTYFDELVAYSAPSGKIMENGQGIVSYHIPNSTFGGLTMNGTSASNSYQAKTAKGATPNPNTRYYYNLDTITGTETEGANAAAFKTPASGTDKSNENKLMSWAVRQYAASNLDKYFYNPFSSGSLGVADTTYDLQGYSWYPVNIGSLTVNGNYILYNQKFELSEDANGTTNDYYRTSHYDTTKSSWTQHRLLHNALFNNVSGALTIGKVSLDGTVAVAKSGDGSGALIYGSINGDADTTAAFNVSTSLILDGIKVYNRSTNNSYAPLLINKVGTKTDLKVSHIWTANGKYNDVVKNTGTESDPDYTYDQAATSLIGHVGSADAEQLKVTFSDVRLDGRSALNPSGLTTAAYNTPTSIFSRATFMESFAYKENTSSYGKYRFEYSEDWDTTLSKPHKAQVTYGLELSDGSTSGRTGNQYMEYYGQEFWYDNQTHDATGAYINPEGSSNPSNPPYDFRSFLPYVKQIPTGSYHQIAVNHTTAAFGGCGTYNHPYSIAGDDAAGQLVTISEIISGKTDNLDSSYIIRIDPTNNRWCNSKSECIEYYWEGTTAGKEFKRVSGTIGAATLSLAYVQEYLANAYYSIDQDDIVLPEAFVGLGSNATNKYVFRGVIIGNGNTITNQSPNPLIYASNGSVVKNLNIVVDKAITLKQDTNTAFASSSGCKAYGAVMGRIMGGDNIIDHVTVAYGDSASFELQGTYANTVALGGYVGVVINGGLIFRGMEEGAAGASNYYRGTANITGLARLDSSKITNSGASTSITKDKKTYSILSSENKKWLYVNPIIGRVLNGYAITEATQYRPFEDGTRTYPDKSKEYWVEYEADVEVAEGEEPETEKKVKAQSDSEYSESSEVYTLSPVTMQNGTKNYSITDVNKGLSNFTMSDGGLGATITIPNAQSLFIISLLTESGLCTSCTGAYDNTNNILKPYADYMATHLAAYDHTGNLAPTGSSPPSSSIENPSAGQTDFIEAAKDISNTDNASKTPYIIHQYTPKVGDVYPAFNLASYYVVDSTAKELYMNMVFSGDEETYYMPDGFRGLGSIMLQNGSNTKWWTGTSNNKNVRIYHGMFLSSLNGNNKTVSLNMSLYLYQNDYENYKTPSSNQAFMKTGYGFFNVLRSNYSTSNSGNKIYNFDLKGNVKYDIIQATGSNWGNHIIYQNNANNGINTNDRLAVGALAGSPGADTENDKGGGSIYLQNIGLNNIAIYGSRCVGGFYGCTNSESKYYFIGCSADNLEVTGTSTGGMIGYIRNMSTEIEADFQNKQFNIIGITCLSTYNPTSNYGSSSAGGLFGENYAQTCKKTGNTFDDAIIVKNVSINNASSVTKGYVGYSTSENNPTVPFSGGVVGTVTRNSYMRLENVSVKNIDICGTRAGGMIGYTNGRAKFTNCEVSTTANCTIESKHDHDDGASGGFIGRCDMNNTNSDSALWKGVFLDYCTLDGYCIAGYRSEGGIIGRTQGGTLYNVNINNTLVKNITLKSDTRTGSLVGWHQDGLINGYNILTNNVRFERYTGTSAIANYGYIIGMKDTTNSDRTIKLAGFSRQGTITRDEMVGNYTNHTNAAYANRFGTNGYVSFADYNNSTDLTSTRKDTMSPVNDDFNVAVDATLKNKPFVTSSPYTMIDSSNYLTGDGIDNAAFVAIAAATNAKKYAVAMDSIKMEAGSSATDAQKQSYYNAAYAAINNELSNSKTEYGNVDIPRFPLLVIEDTDPNNTTKLINHYLQLLTNMDVNFADKSISEAGRGYVYDIDLIKMTYQDSTNQFQENGAACLQWLSDSSGGVFRMYANNVDSGETPQFSLIDLKFYDPANPPVYQSDGETVKTPGKVAYHVYVPVLVKKMRRFSFTAKIDSGTDYYTSHYTNDMKNNTLFQNLGTPLTIEMEYNYERSANDWKEAINAGDCVLMNYYKRLEIKSHIAPHEWPEGTRFVLVDPNNHDKFYYLDNPSEKIHFAASDGVGYLDLWDFTDIDDITQYYGADELVEVAVTQDAEGTLTTVGATAENAAVKSVDNNVTTFYRVIGEGDSINDADRYVIASITDVNHHFKPVDIYELMTDVNVVSSGSGTLTTYGATEANAVVKSGNTLYRTVTSEMLDDDTLEIERFTVNSIGSIKNEVYYLSVFTKDDESDRVYRYEISSVGSNVQKVDGKWSISDDQWSPNKIKDNSTVQLFTGNLFDNKITELTVDTDDHGQVMGEGKNLKLNVQMTAKIALTDIARTKNIPYNMNGASMSHIYQSFLVSLDMKETATSTSKIGIQATPTRSGKISTNYYYCEGETFDDNRKVLVTDSENSVSPPSVEDSTNSFIELRNGLDLRPILANNGLNSGGNNNSVMMRINYDLLYSVDQIPAQFPKGIFNDKDEVQNGTKVIGYSNVASSLDGTSYSPNSNKATDSTFYYSESESVSTLSFHVDEDPYTDFNESTMSSAYLEKAGPFSMIGINPLDGAEGDLYVSTYAIYDASLLNDSHDYVQMRLSLSQREDDYGSNLKLANYLSDLKIYGKGDNNSTIAIFTQDPESTANEYIVTVPKTSLLPQSETPNIFYIPITFKVKTGSNFESKDYYYSNYKLLLEMDMRDSTTDTSPALYSSAKDHIIYTNAKVVTDVIP